LRPDTDQARPSIVWLALVYDRTAQERFPLKRRWLRFNYDRATEEEAAQVLRLVCEREQRLEAPPPDLEPGQASVTVELSGGGSFTSPEILRYRHLFDTVPNEESLCAEAEGAPRIHMVGLAPESYFEDENERSISLTQIFDCEAQKKGERTSVAVVLGQPESILRLGPAKPIRCELWTHDDADLLGRFLATHDYLARSRWIGSRCTVSPSTAGVRKAILPLPEDCMSVILPFRQLYSSGTADDLFNRCCAIHNRHCPKEGPWLWWVGEYKSRFNALLNQVPHIPFVKTSLSSRRYLDTFAYGAGIVHASSKSSIPATDLQELLGANARELVVMGYNFILRTLLGHVSMAACVIRQNVHHWTEDLGWQTPTRLSPEQLLG